MKKTLLLTLVFTFLLFGFTKPLNVDAPTKENTFNYILHELGDSKRYYGWDAAMLDLSIGDVNRTKNIIGIKYFDHQLQCTYEEKLNLNTIKRTAFYALSPHSKGKTTQSLKIEFTEGFSVDYHCASTGVSKSKLNETTISLSDSLRLRKLEKALNHMMNITNSGFDPTLFDD